MRNPQTLLTISKATHRRFILGKQGLYPVRRWTGQAGVVQAVRAGCVVQVDPLNVVARSHDIVLYGRVRDYEPTYLDAALYTDRALFDYGGTVMVHPIEELLYWRVVMARKRDEPRRVRFAQEHSEVVEQVLEAVRVRGPLGTRDLAGTPLAGGSFRSGKVTGQALYYLWLAGELMTHSRRGFERIYDLRERVAPRKLDYSASAEEADDFFALKVFRQSGLATERGWRSWFAGTIERPVSPAEASARLQAMQSSGAIAPVMLEGDAKTPRYVLAEDLPLLEALQEGRTPEEWKISGPTTFDEMVFLAPLDIVSARGRALSLFDFEYLWEVYKPAEKRRWGYYTLPVLYRDRLVARLDPKLDRTSGTLLVKGFWLEKHSAVDDAFVSALAAGLQSFMRFAGAGRLDPAAVPPSLRRGLEAMMPNMLS